MNMQPESDHRLTAADLEKVSAAFSSSEWARQQMASYRLGVIHWGSHDHDSGDPAGHHGGGYAP